MSLEQGKDGWLEATRRIEEAGQSNIVSLDLSDLNLTDVPESLERLVNLEVLNLNSNQITAIPGSIVHLVNLQSLSLNNNQITTVPEALVQVATLRSLHLHGNQITAIPDSLTRMANLQSLSLSSNKITAIPDSLAELPNLKVIFLSFNQITAIPDSFAQLANLERLYISGNRITTIPDSLARASDLQRLALSRNQIAVIPDSVARMTNLQVLALNGNQITAIPGALAQLASLRRLRLSGNQITVVPDSLAGLANLIELDLDGNPLPEEILAALKSGIPSFFRYLQTTATQKAYPRTVKLLLLGEPKSGKTTLLEALKGNPHPCDESRKETLGIDVANIKKLHPTDNQPIYLSVWDFAGQHMEHATHQFFLTENAVYLILWNARQGAESGNRDLWYWPELLKMRVRNPKFLLVATTLNTHRRTSILRTSRVPILVWKASSRWSWTG